MIIGGLSDIVRTIIIMSLSGSILALLLFALKPIVRNRLSKSVQYYLWLVALVALLIPMSKLIIMPETSSNILLAPIHATVKQNVVTIEEEAIRRSCTSMNADTQTDINANIQTDINAQTEAEVKPAQNPVVTVTTAFMMAYPWVGLAIFLYDILIYVIFTTKVRRRRTRAGKDELYEHIGLCGDANPPRLYRSAFATTPMLIGILKPEIILPDREYTDAELQSVLQHELTHLRRRDVIVKWLSVIACALHWFNPIVWLMRREIDRACELSCDEAVIRNLDLEGKQNYGNTLIAVAADVRASRAVLSTTMCEEKKTLKERLDSIMKYQTFTSITQVFSISIIIIAIGTVCVLGAGASTSSVDVDAKNFTSDVLPPTTPPAPAQTVKLAQTPEPTAKPTPEPPADYIIEADYKEGNTLASYNKVYQIGEWIYFAEFEVINRINVNGTHLEKLFVADLGLLRGAGAHGLAQCGEYLVFTQGSYIYKMNLTTLKTEVLISAKNENTCLEFAVKGDAIYFIGTEGDFTDGIYKININGVQPEKVLNDERCWNIQIYNNQIFYSIPYRGLYCVNLDGSSKRQILGAENVGWEPFIISDGYIYFLKNDYSLQRADIDGENITQLVDSCKAFIIRDDYIIYTKLAIENNFHFGTTIYKMPKNKKESVQIYEKDAELYGSCGNWIYFTKPSYSNMLRVRLDGTGEMNMY